MNQMNDEQIVQPVKELDLPEPHILTRLVDANETYFVAGRGTWKTSRGISLYTIDKTYQMPRSTGGLIGLSFEHLFDNTVPPLLHAWDEFGFEHGVHYVLGKEPPKDWERPYLPPVKTKWDHIISWHNGTIMAMISLMKKASANGFSLQWGVFDEAKFMSEPQLIDEIFPIFRGSEQYFKHSSGYLSKFFATDKLADPVQIKWILKKREQNNHAKINLVINLQIHLDGLKREYNGAGINRKQRLKPQIHAVETRLQKLRGNMVFYVEASALDVVAIMGEKWLKDKKRNMRDPNMFNVAILNQDPDKPGVSFYPDFQLEVHTYHDDHDINPVKPFIIAADYQHSVAPIPIAQFCKLPGADKRTLHYVDEVYTLDKTTEEEEKNGNGKHGGLADAVQLFCERHHRHPKKVVYFVYDHTAVGKRVDADAYFHIVDGVLRRNKWHTKHVYIGQAPTHFTKYNNTKKWFQDGDILINRRCKKLIASITGAGAKTTNGKTEKDKSGEKEPTLDQSETTHFSDAFDMTNHAVLALAMIKEHQDTIGVGLR